MFPKNSAFSKTEEQEQYQEGVRQRALNSVHGDSGELEKMVKETREMVARLLDDRQSEGDTNQHQSRARQQRTKPRRPY